MRPGPRSRLTSATQPVALTYKLWKDGTSEPGSFATTYTDVAPGATYTGTGRFMITSQALSGFTGTYPFLIDYDDLSIATPGATADTTAPTVPTGLTVSPAGSKQLDLAWTASTDAVGVHAYKVYRGGTYVATTGSTSWSDTGLTSSTFYSYTVSAIDGAGNESAQTGSASLTTTPDGATTYSYDAAGNRLTAAAGAATITMTYDRLNRILTVDDDDLGTTADTTYTYSLTSPSWTDPSGGYAATLDKFDRATAVNDPVNATDFTWAYRADGQPSAMAQPNGNTTALAYDALGRLTSKDTTAAGPVNRALYDWTYNRAGQVLTEVETITGGASNGTVTYGYDPLARLATAVLSGTTTTYGWDKVPNRTSVQVGAGAAATTTYDVANRPTSGTNPTATYTNDDDGRLTARPNQTLEWDHLGRLTAVKDAAGTTTLARYTYDPLDRLKVVEHPGTDRTRFRYVGATTSVAQWLDDIAGTVTRSVANGWTGERLADWTGSGSNLRIYGTNSHHDTTWLASNTGTVSQSLRYDPWGTPRSSVPSGYSEFRFQGSWLDATVDLGWVVTRWYAPALGRFVSEDALLGEPIEPASRHLYGYGEGEPVGRWDPGGDSIVTTGPYKYRYGDAEARVKKTYYDPKLTRNIRGKLVAINFISPARACLPGTSICGGGDGRSWSNPFYPDCFDARSCTIVNFDEHSVKFIVRPSCGVERADCRSAYPIKILASACCYTALKSYNAGVVRSNSRLTASCVNPRLVVGWSVHQTYMKMPAGINPTIDGELRISACKDWPWTSTYTKMHIETNGDGYPWFEMYYTRNWSRVSYYRATATTTPLGILCLASFACDWQRNVDFRLQ